MEKGLVFGYCGIPGCNRDSTASGYVMTEAPVIGPYPRYMEVCFVHAQKLIELKPANPDKAKENKNRRIRRFFSIPYPSIFASLLFQMLL